MECSFCKPGQRASNSKCVSETCGPNGVSCPPDKPDCCKGQCVDLKADSNNCGTCGNACPAGESCNQGKCVDNCVHAWKPCLSNDQCCQNAPTCCFGYCCPGICVPRPQDGVQCCALAGAPGVCEGDPLPGS